MDYNGMIPTIEVFPIQIYSLTFIFFGLMIEMEYI
jgi:hypothetical protein